MTHPSTLTKAQRASLVTDSRKLYTALWPSVPETQACLYHATALQLLALKRHGVKLMMQAGSCSWPMIKLADDDGECATHYSYVWEGLSSPAVCASIMSGNLPELHVWLAHRDPDTIIDPTTGTWAKRAKNGGHTWTAEAPPEFLWATHEELLAVKADYAVTYEAEISACQIAGQFASLEIVPRIVAFLTQRHSAD